MAIFNSLIIAGENSLERGIYISGEGAYNSPERSVNAITIPGRNGDILIDQGRFENIEVTYPAGVFGSDQRELAGKIRAFRNILGSLTGYKRLQDTYNPEVYRLASFTDGVDISPSNYNRAGEFDITFNCKPQRFLLSGEKTIHITSGMNIYNPTLFASKPLIVVHGAGVVGIGEWLVTISGATSQTIYIDCDTMDAWAYEGIVMVSKNGSITINKSSFPELVPGSNAIALRTGVSSIEITPRWWEL